MFESSTYFSPFTTANCLRLKKKESDLIDSFIYVHEYGVIAECLMLSIIALELHRHQG